MKKSFRKYSFFFGIILFIIIVSQLNLNKLIENIRNIKILYLVYAILLLFPTLVFKSLCWNYIKRRQGMKYSLKESFLMYCSGIFIGLLTPGRIGEFAKIFYLKKDGHSLGKSSVSIFLDRISDLVFLLAFIFLGSLFLLTIFQKQITIIIGVILISVLLFIVFLKTGLIRWFINKMFHIFIPEKYQKSWKINFQDFLNDLKIYKFRNYFIILVITCISWLFYYLGGYALAKGVGLEIPFLYFAVSITIAGLLTLIPISFYGIGTRDTALIILFLPLSISPEQTIIFSNLILITTLATALIGLICWLIKPLKFK